MLPILEFPGSHGHSDLLARALTTGNAIIRIRYELWDKFVGMSDYLKPH